MIFLFAGQFFLHLKTLLGLGGSEAYCCKFPQAKLAILNSHFCLFVFVVAVFVIVFGDIVGFVSHLFVHDFTIMFKQNQVSLVSNSTTYWCHWLQTNWLI